jgi:hypothetical protein
MYNKRVKPTIDREDIYRIEDRDIYYHYLNVVPETNKKYYSPFNKENTPSFRFYYNNSKLLFKDFSSGKQGDAIKVVSELYGLEYHEAVERILIDFKTKLNYNDYTKDKIQIADISAPQVHGILKSKSKNKSTTKGTQIQIVPRGWLPIDIDYWKGYGLVLEDLNKYDVLPCKEVWLDSDKLWYNFNKNNPCYRYIVGDKYKCYVPNANSKKNKWISNCTTKNIQGFKQLPEKGELLIITKSLKDVMVLDKHLGLNAIAFGSESTTITEKIADYFYGRFDNIIMFYDNDTAGINNASRNEEISHIPFIHLPEHYLEEGVKDPSDLYKEKGEKVFIEEISKLLNL